MSRRHKIKHMSSDELKSKLYAHFQKTGSLDHLRTQLRGQLVSELFKVAEPIDADKFPNSSDVDRCLLPLQVCNWLVHDHLSRQDYQYSLSTFVTEAQLPYPEKFLTAGDILTFLGLGHNTSEFENISKLYTEKNELEYLHSLLLAILKTLFIIPNKYSSLNQTRNQESEIDRSYKKKISNDEDDLNQSIIGNKGNVYDASFTGEFSKSKEIAVNKSFSTDYDARTTDLSFQEQLQSVKKESEREVQKLRHKLLEELENLHSQEHKMHLEMEFTKSELKREQNKLIKEKEMLKEKEVLLEKEITNKYEMKMRDAESDSASKLHFKDKEIQSLKAKLLEKDQKLTHVETELSSEKDNCNLMKRELEDLKHMYKIIQDKYSSVLDENTNLLKKFESMSDYTILKEELFVKSNEVTRLQNEIRDIHLRSETERKKYVETVRNLEENLNLKEPQLIQTRKELDQVQNTLSTEKSMWNRERKKLEQDLSEFKELYKTVIQRMEDQKEDIQDLHKTINILNYKLTNNVINVTKLDSLGSFKGIQIAAETSIKNKPENLFMKRNLFLQQQSSEKYNDSSLKFLSDAKTRFGKLKQEEDAVQEKYSYIFSTIPEFNKQPQSYLENYNVSVPKSNGADYSFTPLSKSVSSDSAFSYNKWSKNNITSSIKNPYSLNDVKRMVSNSLFPYKTGNPVDFCTSIGNVGISPTVTNVINDNLKGIRKESEAFSLHSTCDQYNFSLQNENAFISNAVVHKSPGNELSRKQSCDSQPLKSKDEELSKNYETVLNPDQNESEKETVNNSGDFQQRNESVNQTQNVLLGKVCAFPSNETLSSSRLGTIPRSQDFYVQSKNVAPDVDGGSTSLQTSQKIPDISGKLEKTPNFSSPPFISLDAAWKQRSLIPPLSSYTESAAKESNTKESSNNSFVSSLFPPINRKEDDNTLMQGSEKDTNEPMQQVLSTSVETVDEEATKTSIEIVSSIHDKVTESKDSFTRESEFSSPKHIAGLSIDKISDMDMETQKNDEKPNDDESPGKIASADSLSELSEVHLSCGSETEQKKEDSDAW